MDGAMHGNKHYPVISASSLRIYKNTFPMVDEKNEVQEGTIYRQHHNTLKGYFISPAGPVAAASPIDTQRKRISNIELITQHMLRPFWSPQIRLRRPLTTRI